MRSFKEFFLGCQAWDSPSYADIFWELNMRLCNRDGLMLRGKFQAGPGSPVSFAFLLIELNCLSSRFPAPWGLLYLARIVSEGCEK